MIFSLKDTGMERYCVLVRARSLEHAEAIAERIERRGSPRPVILRFVLDPALPAGHLPIIERGEQINERDTGSE